MTLFAAELRKLLSPRLLVIAVILSALYALVFLAPQFRQFTSDHPTLENHALTVRAAQQFGTEISSSEYRTWQQQYQQLEDQADARIAADATLQALKIRTWDQLTRVTNRDGTRAEQASDAARPLFYDVKPGQAGLGYTLQNFSGLLEEYAVKNKSKAAASPEDTAFDQHRNTQVVRSGAWRAIQDQTLLFLIPDFARSLAVLVILIVLLVTAPLPVTDTVRKIRALQYTSRRGRKVFTAQLAATLTAAVIAGLIACAAAAITLGANQVGPFLHNSLWSFQAFPDYRSNQPLLTALLLDAAIVLALAVATGCIAFVLARWSSHYTGLLVRLVIAFALLVTITSSVLAAPFTTSNPLWQLTSIPGVEIIAAIALAAVTFVVCGVLVRREHQADFA